MTVIDRRYSVTEGTAFKAPCRVATTANISLTGLQSIDSVTVAEHDRVLVKDQTDASENGVYEASTGNWSRTKDFDGAYDIVSGTKMFVVAGTNYHTEYTVTTADPITIGSTDLVIEEVFDRLLAEAQADAAVALAAAEAAAALAETSAAALGNQVHQYDTRAQAAAATIPVGVLAIKVTRYATGYPLSYATYIPGTNTGPMNFAEAGGHYWELDLSGGVIDVLWYGATGDDSTDNQTAIATVITKAGTGAYSIKFPQGTYRFSGTLNFGASNLRTVFEGQVTLKHTGAGVAVKLDSGGLIFNNHFGWDNPPIITGNASTTKLAFLNLWDHSKFAAELGNASTAGYGLHATDSVLSELNIKISTNTFTFTSKPQFPIYIHGATDNKMHLVCEGMLNVVYCETVQACHITGTSEGNTAGGGITLDANCLYNVLERFFCEANVAAAGYDFQILGSDNILVSCAGGSAGVLKNLSISGNRNRVQNGTFSVGRVEVAATRNNLSQCQVATLVDAGTDTRGVDILTGAGYIQIP